MCDTAWEKMKSLPQKILPRVFLHAQEVCPLLVKLLLRFPVKTTTTMLDIRKQNSSFGFDSPLLFCIWPLFHQLFSFWVVHHWMHRQTVFPYLFSYLQRSLKNSSDAFTVIIKHDTMNVYLSFPFCLSRLRARC